MKLNNKGWGTLQMLLLVGGLLIALLVAVYFISELYQSFDGTLGNKQHMDLEIKLENAAKEFVESRKLKINGDLTINYSILKSYNFIDELRDINGKECNGYVKITRIENNNKYSGYVSCNNYRTPNY